MTKQTERAPTSGANGPKEAQTLLQVLREIYGVENRTDPNDLRAINTIAATIVMIHTEAEAKARAEAFEEAARIIEATKMYNATPEYPGVAYTSAAWRKSIGAAIRQAAQPKVTP